MPYRRELILENGLRIILLDSITQTSDEDADAVIISGSHGGLSVVDYALRVPLKAVFFNDAGVGKDRAGICALVDLQKADLAAATYSHNSARIGDAQDAWDNGLVSHMNAQAIRSGIEGGMTLKAAVEIFDKR